MDYIDLKDDGHHGVPTYHFHFLDHPSTNVVIIVTTITDRDTQDYIFFDLLLDGLGDAKAKPRVDLQPLLEDVLDVLFGDHFDRESLHLTLNYQQFFKLANVVVLACELERHAN